MRYIVYTLFLAVYIVEYVAQSFGSSARVLSWLPELLSVVVLIMIILKGVIHKQIFLHSKYMVLFIIFVFLVLIGIIINDVKPGAIFSGIRTYFKFVPFFLLPTVFLFTDQEIKKQLQFILLIGILQLPVALYQRFVTSYGMNTGDYVSGTLGISSTLTIFLVSLIAILFGFYYKKQIGLGCFIALIILLLIPTTINETKVTLFLLPATILVTTLVSMHANKKNWQVFPVLFIGFVMVISFYITYNHSIGMGKIRTLEGFDYMGSLYKEAEGNKSLYKAEEIGRLDSIILAYDHLSKDSIKFTVGLGIGNVSNSFSKQLIGEYMEFVHLGPNETMLSHLMWEVGLIGIILVLIGCGYIFYDSFSLSKNKGVIGGLALGWTAVVAIYILSIPYKDILVQNEIVYLFMYFSGYIASTKILISRNVSSIT